MCNQETVILSFRSRLARAYFARVGVLGMTALWATVAIAHSLTEPYGLKPGASTRDTHVHCLAVTDLVACGRGVGLRKNSSPLKLPAACVPGMRHRRWRTLRYPEGRIPWGTVSVGTARKPRLTERAKNPLLPSVRSGPSHRQDAAGHYHRILGRWEGPGTQVQDPKTSC